MYTQFVDYPTSNVISAATVAIQSVTSSGPGRFEATAWRCIREKGEVFRAILHTVVWAGLARLSYDPQQRIALQDRRVPAVRAYTWTRVGLSGPLLLKWTP